jgi:Fe-S-cluster containining protein
LLSDKVNDHGESLARVAWMAVTAEAVPTGDVAAWYAQMSAALTGAGESDVPCGSCTACCRSSQFVHIGPDERATLAVIPQALRFPAPRLPRGHVLLGYDERGHCPMLVDGGCAIYEHRPRACRVYDCRVFAATGVTPSDKPAVAERVQHWRFSFDSPDSRPMLQALRAAAASLRELPSELGPSTDTARAVVAVQIVDLFLQRDEAGALTVAKPSADEVRDAVMRLSSRTSSGGSGA